MKHSTLEITVVSTANQTYGIECAARLTGIHPDMIEEFERGKLVESAASDKSGAPLFDEAGICRLRLLADLRERERLSLRMTRVICHLMDRLERVETEVKHLRNHPE
ncbi:MAG: hypothetical protein P1V20_22975 [Verrucomicrobiales bacterium]|nr:hypothetical protein [Verrucomicrobiales bacterium]